MRNQIRSVSCDDGICDEDFEQDGFMASDGEGVSWDVLESVAREEGWSCKGGVHLCPQHNDDPPF